MENLIFFILGFISFKVLKAIYLKIIIYLAFRYKEELNGLQEVILTTDCITISDLLDNVYVYKFIG